MEFGFPVPDIDPTYVTGQSTGGGTRATVYSPGPPGLALLSYQAKLTGNTGTIVVGTYRPPEPEFTEYIAAEKDAHFWKGTLYFESSEPGAKVTKHCPPGDPWARAIILEDLRQNPS